MEAFHLPMREVRKRFTKSELGMLAWRSSEIAHNMGQSVRRSPVASEVAVSGFEEKQIALLEKRMGPVALKLDEELNMNKLTGAEALQFMSALGIHMGGREIVDDEVTQAYRNQRT